MVTPQFTDLVTSLRERYFRSLAEEEEENEEEEEEEDEDEDEIGARLEREFAVEHGVLPLGTEYFIEYYLYPEGRLIRYNTLFDEIEDENDDPWSLAYGVRIGSKRYPELVSLLPPAPPGGTRCAPCGGTGHIPNEESWNACWHCNGLGWLPPGLEALIERNLDALRAAANVPEEITALGCQFVAEASAIVGSVRPALTYLDEALHRAGFENKRIVEVGDAVASVVNPKATDSE